MTTANGIKLPGHEQYDKLRKALQSGNRSQIDKILESLVKSCQTAVSGGEKEKLDDDQLTFWLNDILPMLFDWENPFTRDLALRAAEAVVPHLVQTLYLDSPAWPALKTQISTDYSKLLEQARGRNDPEWHRKWSVLVRILDKEICQGSVIINVFLAIVESGFRSSELLVREQSFDCWKLLVEIFAKNNQINILKRIKLICIPLKSSKSKTEAIARKKFEIWWFLINKLQNELETFADNVFEPFIYFCFGPSFKTPLCYYFDDSYQEFGAPGKIYNSIKHLSAAALIHMLGPASKITESLVQTDDVGKDGLINFSFDIDDKTLISPKIFTSKAKLIINSCTECTVLFSQMKDKKYLDLNRCLWKNLLAMVEQETTLPRSDMLGWIKENLSALISLSVRLKDDSVRELIYDTLQMVSETNLLTVNVGRDSPEQLVNNYRSFMSLMFVQDLEYPESVSSVILSKVFDLRRHASQRSTYWDMLQKTVQYLSDLEPSLFNDSKTMNNRRLVTQIYCSMASHLTEEISTHRSQFEQSQHIVFSFLLFPMEYDRLLEIDNIRESWERIYRAIVAGQKSSARYACTFSEMIKAMTVAKYNANLGVILDFFRVVLNSVQADFNAMQAPVKTLELLKDLVRKALVFQSNLTEASKTLSTFQKIVEKMTIKGFLAVIMPIRNLVSELVTSENYKLIDVVNSILKSLEERFVSSKFLNELKSHPKEVKWNCKMLICQLLELPNEMQHQWKVDELKKLVDVCEGQDTPKSSKPLKKEGDFVIIEKVWKFTPERLTEHQRDRMREKRDDIPALYNDMSQSQDSCVIKPWTPNKIVIPADARNDHDTIILTPNDSSTLTNGVSEASVPKEQGGGTMEKIKLDKENNNGNVQSSEKNAVPSKSDTNADSIKSTDKKSKTARELTLLKIDTVEGKNLQLGKLARTRRSESLEPTGPNNRRKNTEPKRILSANKHAITDNKGRKSKSEKKNEKADDVPLQKKKRHDEKNTKTAAERSSPRKSLNFDNVVDKEPTVATEAPRTKSPVKSKPINESMEEVIESSQSNVTQSLLARKFTPKKTNNDEKQDDVVEEKSSRQKLLPDTESDNDVSRQNQKSPIKGKMQVIDLFPSQNTRKAATIVTVDVTKTEHKKSPAKNKVDIPLESPSKITRSSTALSIIENQTESKKSPAKIKSEVVQKSPNKITRSTATQLKIAEMETEPNTDLAVESSLKHNTSASPHKSPKKGRPSTSPVPQVTNLNTALESPQSNKVLENEPTGSPNLSPVRNLDEQLDPLTKNLNRSLISSPEGADQDEREADLLNNTLNISPISEDKHHPSTPSVPQSGATLGTPTTGSGEKRSSSRIMEREKPSIMPSPITRRTRNSPPIMSPALASLRSRTPLMTTPRSPSTNRLELRGRGAQLVNLIRSQQNEALSPKPIPLTPLPQNSSTPKITPPPPPTPTGSDRSLMMRKLATGGATTGSVPSPEQIKVPEKPKEEKEYLVFSKVLPSPQASPAASILKRKINHDDSSDDIDSPANKRKRVSFHDPPVSITKEYIRQEEECRSPSINRCLQLTGMSPTDKAKFLLRRKGKADSMSELAKFTTNSENLYDGCKEDEEEEISSSPESLDDEFVINTTANMSVLQVTTECENIEMTEACVENNCSDVILKEKADITEASQESAELPKRTSPRKISPKSTVEEPVNKTPASPISSIVSTPIPLTIAKPDTSIRFQNEDEILSHVISNHSLDAILERCIAAGKTTEQNKTIRMLTKELSSWMTKDNKTRYTVLDELSERHSAEFLDHAVQENSSAMVCQRLSMTTMIEYIFENLRKSLPTGNVPAEEQEERVKVLQIMFDNLLTMHKYVGNAQHFLQMRERFVRSLIMEKTKSEFMELLEEFIISNKLRDGLSTST